MPAPTFQAQQDNDWKDKVELIWGVRIVCVIDFIIGFVKICKGDWFEFWTVVKSIITWILAEILNYKAKKREDNKANQRVTRLPPPEVPQGPNPIIDGIKAHDEVIRRGYDNANGLDEVLVD